MIKYSQDKGKTELEVEGNLPELTSDIMILIYKVYEMINHDSVIMGSLFIKMISRSVANLMEGDIMKILHNIVDKAEQVKQEGDKKDSEGKTMDELIDEFNKWLRKEVSDNDR